jgi:hypothetical protein
MLGKLSSAVCVERITYRNADGTLRFEALSASEASLNPLKDWGALPW